MELTEFVELYEKKTSRLENVGQIFSSQNKRKIPIFQTTLAFFFNYYSRRFEKYSFKTFFLIYRVCMFRKVRDNRNNQTLY